ncbi:hypothetical protein [Pontibacter litorisediminis]|uniref:hypothetical protein n=1 Tax=Pontibacter litorisediminis TaxID=1846260 RepID=UPI0023EC3C35|nr:hypothetical protein [Pontibacter litorisediminis]
MKQAQTSKSHISKSSLDKLKEFYLAVRIMYDLEKLIKEGKSYHIPTVYGQLRALLTDKTKEKSKEKKPLFDIASILGEEIKIYYMPKRSEEHSNFGNPFLDISSLPISIERQLVNQIEISLEDYLNVEVVQYQGESYTASDIINLLSNKYGGSHYDTKVPQYIAELMSIGFGRQPVLDNLIIQIANLFLKVGLKLLKKVTDFELFVALKPSTFSVEENFFFDYVLPNLPARISLLTYQGKLRLFLADILGNAASIGIEKVLEPNQNYIVHITHRITPDLRSEVKVNLNGENVFEELYFEPLLVLNEIRSYQGYINRSQEKEFQKFEFGLGRLMMFSSVLGELERYRMYSDFLGKDSSVMLWFNESSYGHSAPGTGDISMEGHVEQKDNEEVFLKDWR